MDESLNMHLWLDDMYFSLINFVSDPIDAYMACESDDNVTIADTSKELGFIIASSIGRRLKSLQINWPKSDELGLTRPYMHISIIHHGCFYPVVAIRSESDPKGFPDTIKSVISLNNGNTIYVHSDFGNNDKVLIGKLTKRSFAGLSN